MIALKWKNDQKPINDRLQSHFWEYRAKYEYAFSLWDFNPSKNDDDSNEAVPFFLVMTPGAFDIIFGSMK
jgi:hypothetical protein